MKKIILHWTAGKYNPTQFERQFYHFLIDESGKIYNGLFCPEDNLNCSDNRYAAHTGGGNTGAIGIAMCAMCGFKSAKEPGKYPITAVQFESCMNLCAQLALKYNIKISPENIMTHYEFGVKNPKTSSFGKIDITYLPPYPWIGKNDIGNFIRTKIRWYITKNLKG